MLSSLSIKYFAEVSRYGSIRAASEALFVAPSAISRQLSMLEEELSAPLYERGPGRTVMRLTAAGEILMMYVKTLDVELHRVRSEIEALKGLHKGHIKLGIPDIYSKHFFPEFLNAFSTKYPRITFQVCMRETPRLMEMLSGDELDFSLAMNAVASNGIHSVFTREFPTKLLVAATHPLAERASIRLSDCVNFNMALPDENSSERKIYEEMFIKARLKPREVLVTNSYELLKSVVLTGMAVTFMNEGFHEAPESPEYRYVPIDDPLVVPQKFSVNVRAGRHLSVGTLTFIEKLRETLME